MQLDEIRRQFPVTDVRVQGSDGVERPLVFLDHASSTHAPTPVLDAVHDLLERHYANVHRGAYQLSRESTDAFEHARADVKRYLGAGDDKEVVFTANTTGALNLAAHAANHAAKRGGRAGPTIATLLEHHSNLLPHRARGPVVSAGLTPEGRLDLADLERLVRAHPDARLLAFTAASNVTGWRTDVEAVLRIASDAGIPTLLDGAQVLAHGPPDFASLPGGGPDYFAAAGHKAYAPLGCGFLVGPKRELDDAPPFMPGGGTVRVVTREDVTWTGGADRHEGGTPTVVGAVALAAALRFLERAGMETTAEREHRLLERMAGGLGRTPGVSILGSASTEDRVGVVSFNVLDIPPALVARALNDRAGVAVRHGCFCAHPYLLSLLGIADDDWRIARFRTEKPGDDAPGAVRASLGVYTSERDVDTFVSAVREIAADPDVARSIPSSVPTPAAEW